jgi:hypothetical protein
VVGGIADDAVVVGGRLAGYEEGCDASGAAFADDLCHGGPGVVTASLLVDGQFCM